MNSENLQTDHKQQLTKSQMQQILFPEQLQPHIEESQMN